VIAPLPPDSRAKTRTHLVIGLSCAAVVLTGGLMVYKLVFHKPAPAPVEQTSGQAE
jgi:hypothetical protein